MNVEFKNKIFSTEDLCLNEVKSVEYLWLSVYDTPKVRAGVRLPPVEYHPVYAA